MGNNKHSLAVLLLMGMALLSFTVSCAAAQATAGRPQANSGQIEPQAGTWKTWVLASGSQLWLPTPSDQVATKAEIKELWALELRRDAATLDLISYREAGEAAYRWNEMALSRLPTVVGTNGLPGAQGFRGMALMSVAIYDATIAAWDANYTYNRPRPSEFDPSLTTVVPNPRSPSHPSERAVVAGAASAVLAYLLPNEAQFFADKAEEAGRSRLLAGV